MMSDRAVSMTVRRAVTESDVRVYCSIAAISARSPMDAAVP